MRFSSGKAGLFWTFFEPFFQILVFVAIKIVLFGRSNSEIDFAAFLALNFTAYNMFKNILTRSMAAFRANKALFVYKQVKPIDTVFARASVEMFITVVIVFIFVLIGLYFNFDIRLKNFSMVFAGFVWLAVFGIVMGLLLAIANTFHESVSKVIGFLLTGLMFGSAVFYTLQSLPQHFQQILLTNPVAHFMEMIHGSYFVSLDDSFVDYYYMLIWTIVPLALSLWLYEKLEERLITQ